MLSADVDCNRVEQVLVIVVVGDTACALEVYDVFETVLFEGRVVEVQHGIRAHVGGICGCGGGAELGVFARAVFLLGGEFVAHE